MTPPRTMPGDGPRDRDEDEAAEQQQRPGSDGKRQALAEDADPQRGRHERFGQREGGGGRGGEAAQSDDEKPKYGETAFEPNS